MTKAANLAALGSVVEVPTGSAPSFQCRAWVNFNGTGTVAIRASGNVTSINDYGTGDYQVNFTTAMPDANYAAVASSLAGTGSGNNGQFISSYGSAGNAGATAIRVSCKYYNGTANDVDGISVAIYR